MDAIVRRIVSVSLNILRTYLWMVLRSTLRLNIKIYPNVLYNSHTVKYEVRGRKGKHETQVN